ncbi:MAG: formate dehydrogenase accessory sulfurtransferase FdhD [Saprospiraceae bacterium]
MASPRIPFMHTTHRWENGKQVLAEEDPITPEVPLSMRLFAGQEVSPVELAIAMRTPGEDAALVMGYLFSEGVIHRAEDIMRTVSKQENQIDVYLAPHVQVAASLFDRQGVYASSCGLCGKRRLEQLEQHSCYFPIRSQPVIDAEWLAQCFKRLQNQQLMYNQTGGLHAAALLDAQGHLLMIQEDVGRHNALDKLVGVALQQDMLPWRNHVLLLTSRISYELVQKAAMTGVPIVAALGAPTSMALEGAAQAGITLVGFLKEDRFNCYTWPERINF